MAYAALEAQRKVRQRYDKLRSTKANSNELFKNVKAKKRQERKKKEEGTGKRCRAKKKKEGEKNWPKGNNRQKKMARIPFPALRKKKKKRQYKLKVSCDICEESCSKPTTNNVDHFESILSGCSPVLSGIVVFAVAGHLSLDLLMISLLLIL